MQEKKSIFVVPNNTAYTLPWLRAAWDVYAMYSVDFITGKTARKNLLSSKKKS